jgi:DNA polymerase-3 subunit alpha
VYERIHKLQSQGIKSPWGNNPKKKQDVMAAERQVFIYGNKAEFDAGQDLNYAPGCVANGITEDVAAEIWEQMANFAKYAFNRSHAACYAWIGYITAYMSCHWPTEFYAALLNAFIENSDKVKAYLSQAARRGIQLLPPNVNRSECQFKPEQDGIRFGLQGISGLKSQAVGIVREREDGGAYADFQDLYDRLAASGNKLNRTAAEGLIWGGALSSLPESGNQAALLKLFPLLENNYKKEGVFQSMGQMSMFSEAQKISMPEVPDVSEEESLKKGTGNAGHLYPWTPVPEAPLLCGETPALCPCGRAAYLCRTWNGGDDWHDFQL